MTERKPAGSTFESWIDKQIREATERGEFDNLRGAGEPIPGAGAPVDENWWLRGYLRREGVSSDVMLPASLLLRRDTERLPELVRDFDTEAEVRGACAELNMRIVEWLRLPEGPRVPIAPVDADEVVARWRAERVPAPPKGQQSALTTDAPRSTEPAARRRRSRWWRWIVRR
ncbi:DUF1992 domain-containing protein [Nocardia sp. NPDC050710]|uniref:DnaJ family domain-containing protein n=1 Tax=Nocardia sp. NPDC050710 TaxID=3157220 RepID=UPI0034051861